MRLAKVGSTAGPNSRLAASVLAVGLGGLMDGEPRLSRVAEVSWHSLHT